MCDSHEGVAEPIRDWHCQCQLCGHRYYEAAVQWHNEGYDWADSSSYCPACGMPNETSFGDRPEYLMVEGPIVARPVQHRYSSGQAFYLVVCDPCGVVLNSAHHYPPGRDHRGREVDRPCRSANDIATEHDRAHHAPVPAT